MAAPAWATDLTDIIVDPTSTTGWTALGGGASGLPTAGETDYYVQGSTCMSKGAWTNALKGMIYANGGGTPANFTVPTSGVVLAWGYYSAPASLSNKAGGGLRIVIGSGTGAYYHYYVGGSDTLTFESWVPYVVDPNTATADTTTGAPSGTEGYVGILANLPTTAGPTKGNPIAIDAIRYGRHTLTYTLGDGAPNYNTFALAEATANSNTNRWGNIEYNKGVYLVQGFHSFGSSGTAVDFRDSNKVLFIRASGGNNGGNDAVATAYNRFEILNASSNVSWTNISLSALGTRARGVFVHTAGTLTLDSCQFTDMDTFSFLAAASVTDTVFRRCNAVTAPGTNLVGSQIRTPTVAADASGLVWNVATDTDGKLDDMVFTKGTNAHHAIELGTTSPTTVTLRGLTFTGFNASNAQNDSTIYVKRTTGTVTINLVGCSGNISYKTDGATVVLVTDPVTLSVHVQDANTGSPISGARVWVPVTSSAGGRPYLQSISSITRSGSTATVTTGTDHNLATNDYVDIAGATEQEYNGTFQVTVTGATTFTYTVTGTPSTPAGGTKTVTFVVISDLTDGSGDISATYSWNASQPVSGRVRKGSSATYYKTSPISGTIDSGAGLAVTIQMIPDA